MAQKRKYSSLQHPTSPDPKLRKKLPPDPERENDQRAANAKQAVKANRKACYGDWQDALGDLLTDLMHLCDRDARLGNFNAAHARALRNYEEETAPDAEYARM